MSADIVLTLALTFVPSSPLRRPAACRTVLPVALNRVLHATSSDHPHLLLWSPNKMHLKTPDKIDPLTYTHGSVIWNPGELLRCEGAYLLEASGPQRHMVLRHL